MSIVRIMFRFEVVRRFRFLFVIWNFYKVFGIVYKEREGEFIFG